MDNKINLRATSFWTRAEKSSQHLVRESGMCRNALDLLHRQSFLGKGAMDVIESCIEMFEIHPEFAQIPYFNTNHAPKRVLEHFVYHLKTKLLWDEHAIQSRAVTLYWKRQEMLTKLRQAALQERATSTRCDHLRLVPPIAA